MVEKEPERDLYAATNANSGWISLVEYSKNSEAKEIIQKTGLQFTKRVKNKAILLQEIQIKGQKADDPTRI